MKRWILSTLVIVIAVWSATAARPSVSRDVLASLELTFDQRIQSYDINDPFLLLGNTRAIYLDKYGVVFTSELNLVNAVVTPFRPKFTPAQVIALRDKKIARLGELKKMMRAMMVDSATALKDVPATQNIAVGVHLFRYSWENSLGLPTQVLMEAQRQSLLDFETGRLSSDGLDAAIQAREF